MEPRKKKGRECTWGTGQGKQVGSRERERDREREREKERERERECWERRGGDSCGCAQKRKIKCLDL